MRKLIAALAGAALLMASASAMATVVNQFGSEPNLQQVLNSITEGGTSNVNAFTDFINDPGDAYWTTGGTGISSATMIIEIAGNAGTNSFGIYDSSNASNQAVLFGGGASAGSKMVLTFGNFGSGHNLLVSNLLSGTFYTFGSSTFGFYFNNGEGTFYSDSSLNPDNGYDHMVAYASQGGNVQLPGNLTYTPWMANEFILGFEDTYGGGDYDYNDMVLMVESVAPVPEPGTMLLLGAGFLGLAIYGKRRKNS